MKVQYVGLTQSFLTACFCCIYLQKANSQTKTVLKADMRFQNACGYFWFFVLMASSSWSWEAANFRWLKSKAGEFLCGMSPPNETVNDIASRALCVSACSNVCPNPCQAVNYWQNSRLCQHFYYIPCSHQVQDGCINYQVTDYTGLTVLCLS